MLSDFSPETLKVFTRQALTLSLNQRRRCIKWRRLIDFVCNLVAQQLDLLFGANAALVVCHTVRTQVIKPKTTCSCKPLPLISVVTKRLLMKAFIIQGECEWIIQYKSLPKAQISPVETPAKHTSNWRRVFRLEVIFPNTALNYRMMFCFF